MRVSEPSSMTKGFSVWKWEVFFCPLRFPTTSARRHLEKSRRKKSCAHVRGFADFYQRFFFGETPSQKTPDTGLTSIRVAKLGKRLPRGPPHEIGHLCCARPTPPEGGTPPISLRPPKALVVVDSRQSGPPSCTLQVCNCVGRSRVEERSPASLAARARRSRRLIVPDATGPGRPRAEPPLPWLLCTQQRSARGSL